ncbi:hypothetical protein NLJ89_g7106 [Agrocybe chaxingu]|uniref:Uncharacterized protein n=1 Tax=Agrocybe chaxingu TaxID=84603 RepID=A0A9W8JY00_9AGAR|nr:hypothetical protein NLJ89_g7106 [Agrocybe chaxingu]
MKQHIRTLPSLINLQVFGTPRNVSIPSDAFSNGVGSYSLPLPLPKNEQMVLTMSDATGFATGGSSNVLTVGASQGGTCNTTDPGVSFTYELNSALQQCRPFAFSGYSQASQPVTINVNFASLHLFVYTSDTFCKAIVPGGTAINMAAPRGPTFFQWTANAARGTSFIFFMVDSLGRQGGSSDIRVVGFSDDSSCLNGLSPSSTILATSTTAAPSSTNSSPAATTSTASGNGISIAAVAGTVIGALLFLAVFITLGLFFLKRRHEKKHPPIPPNTYKRHSHRMDSQAELTTPYTVQPPESSYLYAPSRTNDNPFLDSPLPSSQHMPPSTYNQSVFSQPSMYPPSDYQTFRPYADADPEDRPSQTYPPTRHNYNASNPSAVDPFNTSAPPLLPSAAPDRQQLRLVSHSSSSSSSGAQRKAAMAGVTPYTPSRFVVHTDADDILPPPNEEGVIELPPQYTERRNPAPGPNAGHPSGIAVRSGVIITLPGGQQPFRLLVISPGQPIRNFSIPTDAFQNDAGSYTMQLLLNQHQRVLLSMSDATGVTAGGITSLLTVGASTSGVQCNTTSPVPDFFFSLDGDLEECKSYPFTLYSGAVQPITITGFIPNGQSFQIAPTVGDSYTWKNNLTAGTSVSFSMTDSQGRTGGTSDIRVVKLSGDQSCLSTSTLAGASSTTTSSGSQNTDTGGAGSPNEGKKSNVAAIAGGAAGGVVALLLAGLLAFFFMRRRKKPQPSEKADLTAVPFLSAPPDDGSQGHRPVFRAQSPHSTHNTQGSISQKGLLSHSSHPSFSGSPNTSPMMSEFGADQTRLQPGPSLSGYPPHRPLSAESSSGGHSQYPPQPPQRVILHTDIAESMPLDVPLELPPQYSAGRAPIPGLPSSTTPVLLPPAADSSSSSHGGGLPGKIRS